MCSIVLQRILVKEIGRWTKYIPDGILSISVRKKKKKTKKKKKKKKKDGNSINRCQFKKTINSLICNYADGSKACWFAKSFTCSGKATRLVN